MMPAPKRKAAKGKARKETAPAPKLVADEKTLKTIERFALVQAPVGDIALALDVTEAEFTAFLEGNAKAKKIFDEAREKGLLQVRAARFKAALKGNAKAIGTILEAAAPAKHAGGRPSKYKPEYAEQAKGLCELGATDYELAKFFKVTTVTLWRWQTQFPEFCKALKAGKEACDDRVERSLYHRATGYTYESEKIFQHQGVVLRAKTVEHVAPDTTAAIIWLKNRRKDSWRDRHEHTGADGAPLLERTVIVLPSNGREPSDHHSRNQAAAGAANQLPI